MSPLEGPHVASVLIFNVGIGVVEDELAELIRFDVAEELVSVVDGTASALPMA